MVSDLLLVNMIEGCVCEVQEEVGCTLSGEGLEQRLLLLLVDVGG